MVCIASPLSLFESIHRMHCLSFLSQNQYIVGIASLSRSISAAYLIKNSTPCTNFLSLSLWVSMCVYASVCDSFDSLHLLASVPDSCIFSSSQSTHRFLDIFGECVCEREFVYHFQLLSLLFSLFLFLWRYCVRACLCACTYSFFDTAIDYKLLVFCFCRFRSVLSSCSIPVQQWMRSSVTIVSFHFDVKSSQRQDAKLSGECLSVHLFISNPHKGRMQHSLAISSVLGSSLHRQWTNPWQETLLLFFHDRCDRWPLWLSLRLCVCSGALNGC